jgi:membrane associated rhomboid family serine protease
VGQRKRGNGRPKLALVIGLASLLFGVLGPLAIFGWRARTSDSDLAASRTLAAWTGLVTGCISTTLLLLGVIRFVWVATT